MISGIINGFTASVTALEGFLGATTVAGTGFAVYQGKKTLEDPEYLRSRANKVEKAKAKKDEEEAKAKQKKDDQELMNKLGATFAIYPDLGKKVGKSITSLFENIKESIRS